MGFDNRARQRGERGRFLKVTQWATGWDCCRDCGTTERPHYSWGRCTRCANRTPERIAYLRAYYAGHRKPTPPHPPSDGMSDDEFTRAFGRGWRKRNNPVTVDQAFRAAVFLHDQRDSIPHPIDLAYDALALAILAPANWRDFEREDAR